jgi:hemolysin III
MGLVAMFICSAAYNLVASPKWNWLLQRLDHAAIFLKIAATYTPFGVIIGGTSGYTLLGVVWTVALLGAAGKLLNFNWNGIDVPLYLVLGWVGLLAYRPLSNAVSPSVLALLGIGGVLYSVGVIFHVWRGSNIKTPFGTASY